MREPKNTTQKETGKIRHGSEYNKASRKPAAKQTITMWSSKSEWELTKEIRAITRILFFCKTLSLFFPVKESVIRFPPLSLVGENEIASRKTRGADSEQRGKTGAWKCDRIGKKRESTTRHYEQDDGVDENGRKWKKKGGTSCPTHTHRANRLTAASDQQQRNKNTTKRRKKQVNR